MAGEHVCSHAHQPEKQKQLPPVASSRLSDTTVCDGEFLLDLLTVAEDHFALFLIAGESPHLCLSGQRVNRKQCQRTIRVVFDHLEIRFNLACLKSLLPRSGVGG